MHDTLLHVVRIAQKRTEVTAAQVTGQQWLANNCSHSCYEAAGFSQALCSYKRGKCAVEYTPHAKGKVHSAGEGSGDPCKEECQYQVKALQQLKKCAYKSTQSLVSSLWAIIFVDYATHVISLHCLCFDCERYRICNICQCQLVCDKTAIQCKVHVWHKLLCDGTAVFTSTL